MSLLSKTLLAFLSISISNILQFNVQGLEGVDFDYGKPEDWPSIFPQCNGKKQSPIDISESSATEGTDPPLVMKGMMTVPTKMRFGQQDNEVQLLFEYDQNPFIITGGSLKSEYKLYSAFFHWGPKNGVGGGHTVDGKGASMSVEFIAYNSKYSDPQTAWKNPDGLIGFPVLIDVIEDDEAEFTPGLEELLPKLNDIQKLSGPIDIEPMALGKFMVKEDRAQLNFTFFQYDGSMVQPPCYECGTWFMNVRRMHVTQEFVDGFRKIRKQAYRPVQPLQGRNVKKTTAIVE